MGVPKYYRWLSERYPLVNQAIQDAIRPEFDCMYLDMNGIVHVSTHGPGVDPTKPLPDDAAMANIFAYIDKVVRLGRPNRLLYMCLDGIAPRAKMNQQRQRRFRSAQDSAMIREKAIAKGELRSDAVLFDSNCITPGTTFMAKLTTHLKFFIQKKIEEDPLWRQFTVLFSGHEVPGEAEHKIVRYIRSMKLAGGYDPNTRHLLYGLDADLIFLSLATHEPHFALLREEIIFGNAKRSNETRPAPSKSDEFQLLHISVLRDCLEHEFRQVQIPFGFDLERIIDDWIFLSFFVGNDFIPHLPSMDIHHGTLDKLIAVYKSLLPSFNDYMTNSGIIDMEKLEVMFHRLSEFELEVLEMQKEDLEEMNKRRGRRPEKNPKVSRLSIGPEEDAEIGNDDEESDSDPEASLILAVKNLEIEEDDLKAVYYNDKWYGLMSNPDELSKLCQSFLEGLQWVLLYYYQGTPSWGWYYPYFYAPLASSMRNLSRFQIEFSLGEPFFPFEQLLAVLPPASAPLIPASLGELMLNPASPILDFYPREFEVDMNGKKNEWEGIALIPFVEEDRLTAAIRALPPSAFTKEERDRNRHGHELIFRFDSKVMQSVKSTIPQIFPSLSISHCYIGKAPRLPLPKNGRFLSHLCSGVHVPASSFPCLNLLHLSMSLAHAGVNVFGRVSKKESLVATIVADPSTSLLDFARRFLGKQCIVDWPFLRDAIVTSVCDGEQRYTAEVPDGAPLTKTEAFGFSQKIAADRLSILASRATDIGQDQVLADVRLFVGMGRSANGATHKIFSPETVSFPAQLLMATRSVPDLRFETAPAQSIRDAFPINCPIIYIGDAPACYGYRGVVLAHDSKFAATIALKAFSEEEDMGQLCRRFQAKERWLPSYRAAQELGMSPSMLGRISSAQLANPGRVNVGLNLKLVQRQLMVPGYTRVMPGRGPAPDSVVWEYSLAAIRLIDRYRATFPDLFAAIDDSAQRIVDIRDFVENPKVYIAEVELWLKSQPCFHLPLVPQTSNVLSPDAILEIERAQAEIHRRQKPRRDLTMENVPIQVLYKQAPRVQWSPTESQNAFLGDRVTFLGGHHGVPFGMKGNIVAIHEEEMDIVFDEPIVSGSNLNGRCSPSRGLSLSGKCVLNLSRPKVPPIPHRGAGRAQASRYIPKADQGRSSETPVFVPKTRSQKAENDDRNWAEMWEKLQPAKRISQTETMAYVPRVWSAEQSVERPRSGKAVARAPVVNYQAKTPHSSMKALFGQDKQPPELFKRTQDRPDANRSRKPPLVKTFIDQ